MKKEVEIYHGSGNLPTMMREIGRQTSNPGFFEKIRRDRELARDRRAVALEVERTAIFRTSEVLMDQIDKRAAVELANTAIIHETQMAEKREGILKVTANSNRAIGNAAQSIAQNAMQNRQGRFAEIDATDLPEEDKAWLKDYARRWAEDEAGDSHTIAEKLRETVQESGFRAVPRRDR